MKHNYKSYTLKQIREWLQLSSLNVNFKYLETQAVILNQFSIRVTATSHVFGEGGVRYEPTGPSSSGRTLTSCHTLSHLVPRLVIKCYDVLYMASVGLPVQQLHGYLTSEGPLECLIM